MIYQMILYDVGIERKSYFYVQASDRLSDMQAMMVAKPVYGTEKTMLLTC